MTKTWDPSYSNYTIHLKTNLIAILSIYKVNTYFGLVFTFQNNIIYEIIRFFRLGMDYLRNFIP